MHASYSKDVSTKKQSRSRGGMFERTRRHGLSLAPIAEVEGGHARPGIGTMDSIRSGVGGRVESTYIECEEQKVYHDR
jgi:hypothetical protein